MKPKKFFDDNFEELKLSLGLKLYLNKNKLKAVEHYIIKKYDSKLRMYIHEPNYKEVYIFNNYEEYKNYCLLFLNSINNINKEILDLPIHSTYKDKLIVLKYLFEDMIINNKCDEFYNSFTKEEINTIHKEDKLTPIDMLDKWNKRNICGPAGLGVVDKYRCDYFDHDCYNCSREYLSHHREYTKKRVLKK